MYLMSCWSYVTVPDVSRCVGTFYLGYIDEIILFIHEGGLIKTILGCFF